MKKRFLELLLITWLVMVFTMSSSALGEKKVHLGWAFPAVQFEDACALLAEQGAKLIRVSSNPTDPLNQAVMKKVDCARRIGAKVLWTMYWNERVRPDGKTDGPMNKPQLLAACRAIAPHLDMLQSGNEWNPWGTFGAITSEDELWQNRECIREAVMVNPRLEEVAPGFAGSAPWALAEGIIDEWRGRTRSEWLASNEYRDWKSHIDAMLAQTNWKWVDLHMYNQQRDGIGVKTARKAIVKHFNVSRKRLIHTEFGEGGKGDPCPGKSVKYYKRALKKIKRHAPKNSTTYVLNFRLIQGVAQNPAFRCHGMVELDENSLQLNRLPVWNQIALEWN